MALAALLAETRNPFLHVSPTAVSSQAVLPKVSDRILQQALEGAVRGYELGHYPYSLSQRRGAALITASEEVFVGAHLQNAAEKPTTDPVSAALYAAMTAGHRSFKALVICDEAPGLMGFVKDQLGEFQDSIPIIHLTPDRASLSSRKVQLVDSRELPFSNYSHDFAREVAEDLTSHGALLIHPRAYEFIDETRLIANLSRISEVNFSHLYQKVISRIDPSISEQQFLSAVYTAFLASSQAYTVRTGYAVGAAILGARSIVAGSNSESRRSESLFACAEATAVATYASHGIGVRVDESGHPYFDKKPNLVVVATPTGSHSYEDLVTPCGGCGSRISELGNPMIVSVSRSGLVQVSSKLMGTDGQVHRLSYEDGRVPLKTRIKTTYFPFLFNREHLGSLPPRNEGLPTSGPFTASDLPKGPHGEHYHIGLTAEMVSPDILICGDPNRVKEIASHLLEEVQHTVENRGLAFITGRTKEGRRVTIASHGMGEGNTEIVMQELLAALSIDPKTGKVMQDVEIPKANIIRIGTSGGLQGDVPLGSAIITNVAFGIGSIGSLYQAPLLDTALANYEQRLFDRLNKEAQEGSQGMSANRNRTRTIPVYAVRCDSDLVEALKNAAESMGAPYKIGMTVSAPGFFGPQGRDIGLLPPAVKDIDLVLKVMPEFEGLLFQNFEMEAATIALLAQGHRVGTVCVAIANRRKDTFDANYKESIARATEIAYRALLAFPRYE